MDFYRNIASKIDSQERLSYDDIIKLSSDTPLMELSALAVRTKTKASGKEVYYNHNFHIEPTNICTFSCKFCSFKQLSGSPQAWKMTLDQILDYSRSKYTPHITEIHIVGGVNPSHTFSDYCEIISLIHKEFPSVAIKAFSAIEHIYMMEKEGISYEDGISRLCASGMDSITGGGAEIFNESIRTRICPDKPDSEKWLRFHETAHRQGVKTNATMLYGHIETWEDRIDHMLRLRDLQDKTGGFNSFIPLKFRSKENPMSHIGECSIIEDLKTLAISRLVLDNIPHIKAYYPMYGKSLTELSLLFGADDIDGTPIETTKIYSMAGIDDLSTLTIADIEKIIISAGFTPIERDTFYNKIDKK